MSWRERFRRGSDIVHTDYHQYLKRLREERCRQAEPGTIAFFDLDRTLIAGYSVAALVWERMRAGSVSFRRVLSSAGVFLDYGLGRADYHDLLSITVRDLSGETAQSLTDLGRRAFEQRVRAWIYAEARELIEVHRQLGHHVVIVTSATRFQAAPIADDLGVDHLCCTEVEVKNGHITGKALPCFGVGKLSAAEHVLHERRCDIERAYFYSDSSDDLPLLEAVGRPVVVNPKSAMARLAVSRGWPCLVFGPPGLKAPAAA